MIAGTKAQSSIAIIEKYSKLRYSFWDNTDMAANMDWLPKMFPNATRVMIDSMCKKH
jgi:hypothetical protein